MEGQRDKIGLEFCHIYLPISGVHPLILTPRAASALCPSEIQSNQNYRVLRLQNILRSNVNQPKPSVLPKRLEVPLGLSIMARLFGLSRMPIRINSCMALLGSLKRLWWPFLAPITLFDEEPC